MGFTGLLILARTTTPLTELDLLAGLDAETVSRCDDHWQLAAVAGHAEDTPEWAATLVGVTTAPVLIAVVDDSDTALLLADSPGGHRWITVLNAPPDSAGRAAIADSRAMIAIAEAAVAWAAEAGHTSPPNPPWTRCAPPTTTTGPPIRRGPTRRATSWRRPKSCVTRSRSSRSMCCGCWPRSGWPHQSRTLVPGGRISPTKRTRGPIAHKPRRTTIRRTRMWSPSQR